MFKNYHKWLAVLREYFLKCRIIIASIFWWQLFLTVFFFRWFNFLLLIFLAIIYIANQIVCPYQK
ncbi:MAG: hypothetical protein PHG08_05370 [Bacilli bacterium]|jgi:hypothetical protein|nr:hypothetical protein [Bacilli bacterium]HHU24607.1 hypothetical protein [Acholeplasmataceae bacterium]